MFRKHRLALLIAGSHLVLGIFYSIAVPLWEAYDEWGHYPYVQYIATHRALPQGDELLDMENSEVWQPPLYYILGAVATFWIDTSDWHFPQQNKYSSLPTAMGGYNRALHGYDEDFPWRGWVLAAHVVRFVSVLLSTITVGVTYWIGRTLFPARREIAWGAMAISAYWPQFLFIGSVINNDNLVGTFAALIMLFMVRGVIGPPRWSDRVGLVLGQVGTIASKIVGLAFLPVTVWGLAWSFGKGLRRAGGRKIILVVAVIALAVALPAGIFLLSHPHYVASLDRFLYPRTPLSEMPLSRWVGVAGLMWGTLWASFGWQSVGIDNWVYDVIQPVWLLALAGLVWFFVRSRERAVKWALLGLLGGVVMVVLMTVCRGLFNAYYFTGRYLLSTISAFSILLAVGLGSLGPRRWSPYILGAVGIGMAMFAVYAPLAYIIPVYARPTKLPVEAVEHLENPLYVDFGHRIELIGYEMEPTTFHPGETVKVSLYWRCMEEMDENYTLAIKIMGRGDEEYAYLNIHPGRGNYPTSLWQEGDIFKDEYWMPISGEAIPLTLARLKVAFFRDQADLEHLPVYDEEGRPLDFAVFFGHFKVAPIRKAEYQPQNPADYELGETISLTGYDLPSRLQAGQPLTLTLYWEAGGPTERPFTVFVHVVDDQGRAVAQADSQPVEGNYPTDLWADNEVISDTHAVALPGDLPAGPYDVWIGLYSVETGQRLPVLDDRGQPVPDDRIHLGEIQLEDVAQ